MRKILILFILNLILFPSLAQIQWASKVIGVSSEKKGDGLQYKAEQVLGKPNVLPLFKSSPSAWSPAQAENDIREEYIHVGFEKSIAIKQIVIAESFNAGSISQVFAYDEAGTANLIYKNPSMGFVAKGRLLNIAIPQTPYKVVSVKVTLNTAKVVGENQIDAIGISESDNTPEISPTIVKNATKFNPEPLSSEVNSPYLEANPVLSPSGKRLYFTRLNHPENTKDTIKNQIVYKQDIWYANINDDGTFGKAINVGSPLNNRQHNAAFTIAPDESYMLLNNRYLPDGRLDKGLSITRKTSDGNWGKPEPLNIEDFVNKSDFSEFWLSKDGKALVMSIIDDKTQGGNDLYVSFRKTENTFSKPVNMGKVINSAGEEATPWLDEDGKTLYFSSTGFSGFGDFDIFVSKRLDDTWTNWSEPENLGSSINTNGMDIYFSKQGFFGYYSSRGDIYKVRMLEPILVLSGKTLNAKNNEPISANLIIEEASLKTPTTLKTEQGNYTTKLNLGKKYLITAEAKGFFPREEIVDASELKDYTELQKDFLLVPLEKDQAIRLNFISFARGESLLLPESYAELNKVVKMMNDNPNVKIRLEGHTEIYGNKKGLMKLSKNRVVAVKEYLTRQGVPKKRIDYKAFGSTRPLTTEDTEKARQLNRRVEIRVI
ncbi:hypothetical protein AD998_00650 [bacterium 336/3]|nr:hypothetical protein AD998_00650 [bacterium 336/3]